MTPAALTAMADRYSSDCIRRGSSPKVKDLARQLEMTPGNFSDYFLRVVGERPSEYLKRLQIECVKRLLETTDLSIEEIAERCCFRDASILSRLFSRMTGMPPGEYRRRMRRADP